MSTTKTLRMVFDTDLGREAAISVSHCRADLTASEVLEAMETLISNPVFVYGLSSGAGAEIVERTVTKLF